MKSVLTTYHILHTAEREERERSSSSLAHFSPLSLPTKKNETAAANTRTSEIVCAYASDIFQNILWSASNKTLYLIFFTVTVLFNQFQRHFSPFNLLAVGISFSLRAE
jgi:hypothetical protein